MKTIVVKKKKAVIFSGNSYHILLALFCFDIDTIFSSFVRSFAAKWHILHHIEEVSNLISLLREYEANTITRNVMRCNNRYGLLNLSFILKFPTFSKVYLPSRTYMAQLFFRKKASSHIFDWIVNTSLLLF